MEDDRKIVSLEPALKGARYKQMLIDRVRGVQAKETTGDEWLDPANPNAVLNDNEPPADPKETA